MFESFKSFDVMLQGYWILAAISSLVFVIQAISIVIGLDADTDADAVGGDAEFDADGFHLVSIKTVVCFILGFGWSGVIFWDAIENKLLLATLAFLVGLSFMMIIAVLLRWVMKLDKDNTFRTEKTIGLTAEVYLKIPAERQETGKIMVSLNGSTHEIEALTDDTEEIPTGGKVQILSVVGPGVVLVKKC